MNPPVDTESDGTSLSAEDAVKYYRFHVAPNKGDATDTLREVTASDVGRGGLVLVTRLDQVDAQIGVDRGILACHCLFISHLKDITLHTVGGDVLLEHHIPETYVRFHLPDSIHLEDLTVFLCAVYRAA